MAEPDELTLMIARRLELDWRYTEFVQAWDAGRVDRVRSAGRRAGRLLGYKIVTVQSEPDDEGCVTVVVAVREAPNAEEQERMSDRARLLMEALWSSTLPTKQPDQ